MFGNLIDIATSPLRVVTNTIEVVDGLTEGELRTRAALSVGAEIAGGMAVEELVDWYLERN